MEWEENKTEAPHISVIVPAYNAAESIASCIEALQRQELEYPFELIIVDDGSSDNTVELAESYGVRVIKHGDKRGRLNAELTQNR